MKTNVQHQNTNTNGRDIWLTADVAYTGNSSERLRFWTFLIINNKPLLDDYIGYQIFSNGLLHLKIVQVDEVQEQDIMFLHKVDFRHSI